MNDPDKLSPSMKILATWILRLVDERINSHTVNYHQDSIGWLRDARQHLEEAWAELERADREGRL